MESDELISNISYLHRKPFKVKSALQDHTGVVLSGASWFASLKINFLSDNQPLIENNFRNHLNLWRMRV